MNNERQPTIVVGVSGSRASAAALSWAAAEARRRRARLRVVRSWAPLHCAPYAPVEGREAAGQQRAIARRDLAAALRAAFGSAVPNGVAGELVEGAAERTLVDRSAGADLLVLGATSPPSLVGRSVGPVIQVCLSRAHCPVVVVSTDADTGDDRQPGDRPAAPRMLAGDTGRGHLARASAVDQARRQPYERREPSGARAAAGRVAVGGAAGPR